MDFCVISPGGVGCSSLLDFCNRNMKKKRFNSAVDKDGIKHLSFHNFNKNKHKFKKILFIMNDSLIATESLFRRNYAWSQSGKLLGKCITVAKNREKFYNMTKKKNREILGIDKQIDFYTNKVKTPIMFIDFNSILDKKEEISKFLGVSTTIWKKFHYRERRTRMEDIVRKYPFIDETVLKIYNDINEKYKKLNGVIMNC